MSYETLEWQAQREKWCNTNLEGAKRDSQGTWLSAKCPIHSDGNASLRVNLETGGCTCHASSCGWTGTLTALAQAAGLPPEGLRVDPPKQPAEPKPKPVQYVYTTPSGAPYSRFTRWNDQTGKKVRCAQSTWNGSKWVPGKARPAALYNAKALAAAPPGSVVLIVEGEKCAEHLIQRDFLATTSPEGAKKFDQVGRDYLDLLLQYGCFFLPDNDKGGFEHVLQAAERLRDELAIDAKIVILPGLEPKGDVADWLQAPRTKADLLEHLQKALTLEEFKRLYEQTFPGTPEATQATPKGQKVVLSGISGQRAEQILSAVRRANNPVKAFVWKPTGRFSDLRSDGEIIPCNSPENLAHLLENRLGLVFHAINKEGVEYPIDPPEKPLKRILGMPAIDAGLPVISEFIDAPVLASDGTLIARSGLHSTGIYLREGLEIPPVPASPSPELVSECVAGINRLLADFPFEEQQDRQACWSYILSGFVANKVPRPWPMWHFSAPCQGSGKGLLASLPSWITQGCSSGVISIDSSEKDPEIRKKLTSIVDGNPGRWQILDNVKGYLSSGALEAFLTTPVWRDRVLGGNKMGEWPVNIALALTGNNLTLSPDLERRQVLVRLLPDSDQPWLRNDFEIPDLTSYILANRARIVWQILVIIQRWSALGFPQGSRRLGSFEGWSAAIGGLLDCVGIGSDFLANARAVHREDPWKVFMQLWSDSHIDKARQRSADLVRFTEKAGIDLAEANPAMSLGKKLAKQNGKVFAIGSAERRTLFRLRATVYYGQTFWSLEPTKPRKVEDTQINVLKVPKCQEALSQRDRGCSKVHGEVHGLSSEVEDVRAAVLEAGEFF